MVLLVVNAEFRSRLRHSSIKLRIREYFMSKEFYRFGQVGEEPVGERPICVRFPQSIDEQLRAMPDRSAFIRKAVADALARSDD